MNISILTPDKELFIGQIVSVKVPGTSGQFQVLKNHAPIVSSLEKGRIDIVTSDGTHQYYDEESGSIQIGEVAGKTYSYEIKSGFIEVLNNEVSLLITGAN